MKKATLILTLPIFFIILSAFIVEAEYVLSSEDLSISADRYYLKDLIYPLNSGNSFIGASFDDEGLMRAADGYAISFTYKGVDHLSGLFFGDISSGRWKTKGSELIAEDFAPCLPGNACGPLKITSTVSIPEKGKWVELHYRMENTGDNVFENVKFYKHVEPNVNGYDEELIVFDSAYNLIYSTNDKGLKKYFGVLSPESERHHIGAVSGANSIFKQIQRSYMNNANTYNGNGALVFEKDIGNIHPGEYVELTFYFIVGDTLSEIQETADYLTPEKPVPEPVLDAENELFESSKSGINVINEDMGYIIEELARDAASQAFSAAADQLDRLELEDRVLKEVMELFCNEMVTMLYGEENGSGSLNIREMFDRYITVDDVPVIEVIETKHQQFTADRVKLSPSADIPLIVRDIQLKRELVEKIPDFVVAFREKYDLIEEVEEMGGTVSWVLATGGIVCGAVAILYPPSAPFAVPAAAKMLATSGVIKFMEIGSNVGEAVAVAFIFGDVYTEELRIAKIYVRELDRTKTALEDAVLPVVNGKVSDVHIPEKVILGNTEDFSISFSNTGGCEIDARAVLEITNPEGHPLKYYSKTQTLKPGEQRDFRIEVPFPCFYCLFGAEGRYIAEMNVEYGMIYFEEKTKTIEREFYARHPEISIFKQVKVIAEDGFVVSVVITVKNNADKIVRGIELMDSIPKHLASTIDEIEFLTPVSEIIDPDPAVKWRFDLNPGEVREFSYRFRVENTDGYIELPPASVYYTDSELNMLEQNSPGVIAKFPEIFMTFTEIEYPSHLNMGNVFEINAEIKNTGCGDAEDVSVYLYTSEGLNLVSGEKITRIDRISAGDAILLTWHVRAEKPGIHELSLHLHSGNAGDEVRRFSIDVESLQNEIPEFKTIALPTVIVIGVLILIRRKI